MFTKMALLFVIFLNIYVSLASDPDPVQDFCIANTAESATASNAIQCKNSSLATVEDFVYSGIKSPGKFGQTVGGVNVPHYHPRATETAFVLEGKIYSGFVDTNNKIFAKVIEKGEVMVFPKGLVHFQMNVGDTPATILGSFNSQNPGLLRIPTSIFGSGIKDELLEKAFGLSSKEITKLKKKLGPH
ncbi:hypothetical protein ACLB2K_072965 [Fragaria x ananassa]